MKEVRFEKQEVTEVFVPRDLSSRIAELASIERFANDDRLTDNVRRHTLACVNMAKNFGNERLQRMLFIHDIPELLIGDTPVSLRKNDYQEMKDELSAARSLLDDNDMRLFLEFKQSQMYLEGYTEYDGWATTDGLLANIIDRVEGNVYFHQQMASQGLWEPEFGRYTKAQARDYERMLDKMSGTGREATKRIGKFILQEQLDYIDKLYA